MERDRDTPYSPNVLTNRNLKESRACQQFTALEARNPVRQERLDMRGTLIQNALSMPG